MSRKAVDEQINAGKLQSLVIAAQRQARQPAIRSEGRERQLFPFENDTGIATLRVQYP